MAVSGVGSSSAVDAATTAKSSSPVVDAQAIQDRFMKLLVEQLKNQDPLNPMENAQITSQMSQISTVTGIQQLNSTMTALADSLSTQKASQAIDLMGKSVSIPGKNIALSEVNGKAEASMNVWMEKPADTVKVSISDARGNVVKELEVSNVSSGLQTIKWDGTNQDGTSLPVGHYTATVTALAAGNPVVSQPLEWGRVASVERDASGSSWNLVVSRLSGQTERVSMSDVRSVIGQ